MFYKTDIITDKMNRAGQAQTPFLFGIDYELNEGFFVEHPEQQNEILFRFGEVGNVAQPSSNVDTITFDSHPVSFEDYKMKFDNAIEQMKEKEVELINLTIKTPLATSLSLSDIFNHSKAKYLIHAPGRFVCFSPETFVRTAHGKLYSYPMKGTISADVPDAEATIINNPKEIAEHTTAVELVKEDLSKIGNNIHTRRFRYVETIENHRSKLLQVSSEVEAALPHNFNDNIGTHILKLLPAGSIAGYPKAEALDIISAAEGEPRSYYSGIAGYFDGQDIDCCVLIRFIEETDGHLFFRSGGGITLNSRSEHEYREAIQKIYLPF